MIKLQRIRKLIQFISLILFPITINYLSPYVIVMASLEGVVNGSMIVFIGLLALSIFTGRLFCSILCPGGAISDCLTEVNSNTVKNGRWNMIKWVLWVPWFGFVLYGLLTNRIIAIEPFFMTEGGISVNTPRMYIIYLGVVFLFLLFSTIIGKRATCHYVCWMAPFMILGIKLRKLLHLKGLTLDAKKDECISCKICTKQCPMSLDVEEMVREEAMTNTECIMCGKCISSCSKGVINYSFRSERNRDK